MLTTKVVNPQRPTFIQHFRVESDASLVDWFAQLSSTDWPEVQELSSTRLQELLHLGALYQNGKRLVLSSSQDEKEANPRFENLQVKAGDILRLHFHPRRYLWNPEAVSSWIKMETKNFILVEKPAGLPTHPTLDNIQENLLAHLQYELHPEALICNRLDVGTEGLILFARNPAAQRDLQEQTRKHELTKIYSAIVPGHFPQTDRMESWMDKSERSPKQQHFESASLRDFCQTQVERVQLVPSFSILTLKLITGRTHQIRSQLQLWGHALVGDKMYGSNLVWNKGEIPTAANSRPEIQKNESWALRSTALGWKDEGAEYFFEIPDFTEADFSYRMRSLSSEHWPSDFEFSSGPRSTRSPHRSPPENRSRADLRLVTTPEPPSPKPQ